MICFVIDLTRIVYAPNGMFFITNLRVESVTE